MTTAEREEDRGRLTIDEALALNAECDATAEALVDDLMDIYDTRDLDEVLRIQAEARIDGAFGDKSNYDLADLLGRIVEWKLAEGAS